MKRIVCILLMTLMVTLTGCSNKAEELYDIAQLEELQNNHAHAVQLYQELLEKHPDSDFAQKAKERLSALQGKKNDTD
jgi:TolA-binding protein